MRASSVLPGEQQESASFQLSLYIFGQKIGRAHVLACRTARLTVLYIRFGEFVSGLTITRVLFQRVAVLDDGFFDLLLAQELVPTRQILTFGRSGVAGTCPKRNE